jgi:hypothetical protein
MSSRSAVGSSSLSSRPSCLNAAAMAETGVELLSPVDAIVTVVSLLETVQIGEIAPFRSINDCEDLGCGQVLGCQCWHAVDHLGGK